MDASFSQHIAFEIITLVKNNLLNLGDNWEGNCVYLITKKISSIWWENKKEKPRGLIDKKLPKLNKKTKRKPIICALLRWKISKTSLRKRGG